MAARKEGPNLTQVALKDLREQKKMSQEELADKSGISRTTISLIENGNSTTIKLRTLQKLAEALGVSVEYFFTHKV